MNASEFPWLKTLLAARRGNPNSIPSSPCAGGALYAPITTSASTVVTPERWDRLQPAAMALLNLPHPLADGEIFCGLLDATAEHGDLRRTVQDATRRRCRRLSLTVRA
ncbi:hypothetical protein KXD97_31510 [Mycobacterium sp. SMC-8]|uniref:hypothetical protein n=1 Tax=Mycobacterium sp. SMC-8 TaxID=2857060 RepID=UPI0021B18CD1|nr:hypothetical protein [Mycobacterium sp. SMC-8]UXA12354.1 hypothetical protein KXD97_31510 [Mycobacterium sp. SMC-8]